MFKIIGQVVNLFTVEAGEDKDGKPYDEKYRIQIMGTMPLQNGDTKVDLVDLTVDDLKVWQPFKNKTVSIDVGQFAPGKGKIIHFVRKGATPKLLS